jgi:hypothetical protein
VAEAKAEQVAETPKADKPTETPKAEAPKAEVKEEAPKAERPKYRKKWGEKKEAEPTAEKTEVKTEAKADGLTADERQELATLRSLINKPSVKHVLKAEESGKDFVSYYDELKQRDPNKMSYSDIYKLQLKDQGATESEIERKLAKFEDEKDEDEQFDIISSFRKQLKNSWDKELNDYTPKVEKQADVWEELNEPYQNAAKQYENKELFGIKVTPDMAKQTAEFYKNNSLFTLKDGKIDADDMFKKTFLVNNIDLIVNEACEAAYNEGFEEAEKRNGVGQPLSSQNGASVPQPRSGTAQTEREKRIQNLKASLPQA